MRGAMFTILGLNIAVLASAFIPWSFSAEPGFRPVLFDASFPAGSVTALSQKAGDHLQVTLSTVSNSVPAPARSADSSPIGYTGQPVIAISASDALLPAAGDGDLLQVLTHTPTYSGPEKLTLSDHDLPNAGVPSSSTVALPPAAECETSISPLYCVYTVTRGDTLTSIAQKFKIEGNDGVSPLQLLVQSNRPDVVSEGVRLAVGQRLRIPLQTGVIHVVEREETLVDVARQFGVSTDEIKGVSANALSGTDDNWLLRIGLELVIPRPTRFTLPAEEGALAAPARAVPTPPSSPAPTYALETGEASEFGFVWPASGRISSYFSPGHPLGIDIDFAANPGPVVGAAAPGTVTFAGGNPCCSYGYYVIVDHGNGVQTLYAHLSRISVAVDQSVVQGQVVGVGGRTGYATGEHLHFEVRLNGSHVDPLYYLP
jgi:murein DD-endopeptidase MepM/ murein hydrolase activator NlpD